MHIVDRRLNPGGKNLANRQRFMRRAKSQIRKAVHESTAKGSIKDADDGGEVVLPAQGVHEPQFRRSSHGGFRDHLLPGNKEYVTGDTIPRPAAGKVAVDRKAVPTARGKTISASLCRGTNSLTCSWKIWNFPIWPSARSPARKS
jgi:uncharacterized sporulation protein YeaH/YhbH (DUF444 family)